jgi:hypothetical protein
MTDTVCTHIAAAEQPGQIAPPSRSTAPDKVRLPIALGVDGESLRRVGIAAADANNGVWENSTCAVIAAVDAFAAQVIGRAPNGSDSTTLDKMTR